MLEHKPPHVRRKIALIITTVVLVALIVLLAITLAKPHEKNDVGTGAKLRSLFDSIYNKTESTFNKK